MNKLRLLTFVAISLLVLNIGTLAYLLIAQQRERPQRRGETAASFIIEELNLDNNQQLQFAELRQQHQSIMRAAHDEDRKLHDIYFSLLKTNEPDKQKVDSIAALMAVQRSKIESATFDHFQQLRSICRDDQKKKFDATIDEIARRVAPKGPPPGGPPRD